MSTKLPTQTDPIHDPNAILEKAFMQEFLQQRDCSLEKLKELPAELADTLMKGASQYASLKMEEMQARAHFIEELHEDSAPFKK